jgi:hypothetical protein
MDYEISLLILSMLNAVRMFTVQAVYLLNTRKHTLRIIFLYKFEKWKNKNKSCNHILIK